MNILLIHSDQHRYDCLGVHGRTDVHTPHLDALARSGATFSRAYSTVPVCTPARASLATGAWPSTHGSFFIPTAEIDRAARPGLPTIFGLLRAAGYRNAWTGKFHGELEVENGAPGPAQGVDDFVSAHGHRAYLRRLGFPPAPEHHGWFGDINDAHPAEHSSLAWQADNVIRQLGDGSDPRPFFVRWDPPEPHIPCRPSPEFAARYADAPVPPWPSFPDPLTDKPAILRRQRALWGIDGWTWEKWCPLVRLYLAVIAELDLHIGRVLGHLERIGRAHDTLVIYSTDHGDFMGGHGLFDKHYCMYEDIVRVPLLVRAPGRVRPGTTCDAFASGALDIARTLLSAAGVAAPASFVGHDLLAMAADGARPRQVAYVPYYGAEAGLWSCRMLRDERHKFVYHPAGETDELYDLERDPGELRNLASDSAHADVLARLKERLFDEMHAQGDRLANIWTEIELRGAPSFAARAGL